MKDKIRIAVQLTPDTFERVKLQAAREDKSFSEMVEYLVTCGLLCLDESDALEPAA